MAPDAMIFFWMLSFKPAFSLSSFIFIKRLFSSSSLSAKTVVLSADLRLLIFLLVILIPAYASSSLAFHMMYSAYKLNKQSDNTQPWRTPSVLTLSWRSWMSPQDDSLWWMVNGAPRFRVSKEDLTLGPTVSVTQNLVSILFKVKVTEKASGGAGEYPPH